MRMDKAWMNPSEGWLINLKLTPDEYSVSCGDVPGVGEDHNPTNPNPNPNSTNPTFGGPIFPFSPTEPGVAIHLTSAGALSALLQAPGLGNEAAPTKLGPRLQPPMKRMARTQLG